MAPRVARVTFWFGSFAILLALALAYWLEYEKGLAPCPLCLVQRGAWFVLLGAFFLAAWAHPKSAWGLRLWGLVLFLPALAGMAASGRQAWLQSLPPEKAPPCGPGLGYLFKALPWQEAMARLFEGSGECAVRDWEFLGLTLAGWSFLGFAATGVLSLRLMASRSKP